MSLRVLALLAVIFISGCADQPVLTVKTTPPATKIPSNESPAIATAAPAQLSKSPAALELTVAAVGDVMLGTDFPENYLPANDGQGLLAAMTPIIKSADIRFGNFEGTLLDGGEPVKQCKSGKNCYLFRTPQRFVQRLVDAGFNVMSLANNHARDFGEKGRSTSMQVLAAAGIHHSGREGDIASWEVKGRHIALIAYAPFAGAHDPSDLATAATTIAALKQQHDIVIVSMHMGAEGAEVTHLTFNHELFHGEDRGDSVAFAHAVIDAGADLVIGHGPHVPRALELYHDRLIAYSLGNFCTYQGINVSGINGLAPVLTATLAADGRFLSGHIHSARQQRPLGPVPDPHFAAARLMAGLTSQDFSHTLLTISPEGDIQRKMPVATTTRNLQESSKLTHAADDKSGPGR